MLAHLIEENKLWDHIKEDERDPGESNTFVTARYVSFDYKRKGFFHAQGREKSDKTTCSRESLLLRSTNEACLRKKKT